jgi:hypothetical protein
MIRQLATDYSSEREEKKEYLIWTPLGADSINITNPDNVITF